MPKTASWSLRRRLILIFVGATTTALLAGGVAMDWAQGLEDGQMTDARLEQLGSAILSLVESDLAPHATQVETRVQIKSRPTSALLYRYQVWSRDGRLLLRSHEAPADRPIADLQHLGFETARLGGERYRVFSLPTHDGGVVQVAENLEESVVQGSMVAGYYMSVLLIPFALVFGVSWLAARRSLRSIDALAGELRQRNPLDVTALSIDAPPEELRPILVALESLFTRAGHALSVERRFTSIAAHEMRTPLAGLRAQAQVATSARDAAESRAALGAIMSGVDRAAQMLDQLLDLARVEAMSEDAEMQMHAVGLKDAFDDAMHTLSARAQSKNISVHASFAVAELHGLGFGLGLLLRNLLANAILYCPEGGRVEVGSSMQGKDLVLVVDDSGPGIAPLDRDRAFERFNRLGRSEANGVGLGLSIVLLVVELHRARIQLLGAPIGGLRVQITFPPARRPASSAMPTWSRAVS